MPYTKTDPPIFYESHGQGRAIVFCHSLGIGRKAYTAQVQCFSSKYKVIVWDQRGHGKSAHKTLKDFSFYDSVEDLRVILAECEVTEAVFVGAGQGGYLCTRFALRYPEIIKGMFLIGAQATVDLPEMKEYWLGVFEKSFQTGEFEPQSVRTLYSVLTEGYSPNEEEGIKDIINAGPVSFQQALNCLIDRDDVTTELHKIVAPTLMAYGDAETIPFVAVQEANDRLRNSKLEVLSGPGTRGYCQPLTAPTLINQMLEQFTSDLDW